MDEETPRMPVVYSYGAEDKKSTSYSIVIHLLPCSLLTSQVRLKRDCVMRFQFPNLVSLKKSEEVEALMIHFLQY